MANDAYIDEYDDVYNEELDDFEEFEEISFEYTGEKQRIGYVSKHLLLGYAMMIDLLEILLFFLGLGIIGSILGSMVSTFNIFILFIWFKMLNVSFFERLIAGGIRRKLIKLIVFLLDIAVAVLPIKTILMYVIIKEVQFIDKRGWGKYVETIDKYLEYFGVE